MISAIWLILPVIVVGLSSRELILMRKRSGFTYDSKALPGWEKDLPQIARNHMQVNGVLAGFSITVVVLIAGLMLEGGARGLGFLEQFALGKLMVAFFGYVATAILFSIVSARSNLHRFFLFSSACLLYHLSALLSVSALLPLLDIVGAPFLRLPIILLIAAAIVGGYMAVWIPLFDLMRLRRRLSSTMFLLAASITGVYLGLGHYVPLLYQRSLVVAVSLQAPVAVISLAFLFCILSFFYQRVAQETTLMRAAVLVTGAGTATVVFLSSVTILLVRP